MDWLIQQLADVVKGLIVGVPSFLLGLWLYNHFILKRQALNTIDAASQHPTIQKLSKKLEQYEKDFGPLIDQAKQLNLQELIDLAKSIRVTVETLNKQSTPPPPPPKTEAET